MSILILSTNDIENKFSLITSNTFKKFETMVLEWYRATCGDLEDNGFPQLSISNLFEYGAEDFYPLVFQCIQEEFAKFNLYDVPSNVNQFTEEDNENAEEYMSQMSYQIEQDLEDDVYKYLKQIDFSFRHGNSYLCDYINHPVVEVW